MGSPLHSRALAARRYVFGASGLSLAALATWSVLPGFPWSLTTLGAACVLAAVGAVSRSFTMDFGFGKTELEIEIADVAILTALALGGPLCALLVAVPSMAYRDWLRTLFQASSLVLSTLISAYVFGLFAGPLLLDGRLDAGFAFGVVAAGFAFCLADAVIASLLLRIKYGMHVAQLLKEVVLPPVPSEVLSVVTALGTSYAAATFGPVAALALFAGGAIGVFLLHLSWASRKELEDLRTEVSGLREKAGGLEWSLVSSHAAVAARLVGSLGRKDGRTAEIAAASAVYAKDLAKELGVDPTNAEKLWVAALLQDVGLVGVPDEVLLTPQEKLNSVGRSHLREHPEHGERILSAVPEFQDAARWVRWHHEREDGTGYPDRLRGEWMPLEAKVLATASFYASLVLEGTGRPGMSPQEARQRLADLAASGALNTLVVRTFLRVLDEEDGNYAAAADDRFGFSADRAGRRLRAAGNMG